MKTLTRNEIAEIWLDSTVFRTPRTPQTPDDWGDAETVGVHLKLIGRSPINSQENDFGIFLGKHPIGFVVGVKTWDLRLSSGEAFETLEDLKQRWEID